MPNLEGFESVEESDVDMSDAHPTIENHSTPPPVSKQTFASKLDLVNSDFDDDVEEYGYDDEPDDSELEIYGQVKGVQPVVRVASISGSQDGDSVRQAGPLPRDRRHSSGGTDYSIEENRDTKGVICTTSEARSFQKRVRCILLSQN
jgi:hypothetical protein